MISKEDNKMSEDFERIEDMEAKETRNKLPIGWLVLYIGLIVWGIYYLAAYTPQLSGWSQAGAYEKSVESK